MKKLKRYFLIFHTTVLLFVGIVMWFILKLYFPEILVKGYTIIPLFFYILGLVFISRFKTAVQRGSAYLVNLYVFMRMIKMFTSFAIIIIYWFVHKEGVKNFAIIFLFYYLLNILWETHIYLRMEKYIKQEHIDQ